MKLIDKNIRPNSEVDTGNTVLTSPPDKGLYTLYEETYSDGTHRAWIWFREGNTI